MRIALIGADLEENLGLCMLGAVLRQRKHRVDVVPYDDVANLAWVVERTRRLRPGLVGLGMQFQHRAHDFLLLAERLRSAGLRSHLTCGGQFATVAWQEILAHHAAVDTVVFYEGERTIVELVEALERGAPLDQVRGLGARAPDGQPSRTEPRPLEACLDTLPFGLRYREHTHHLGIPYIPLSGSRGCWNSCTFCAITTFYRDARQHGGGKGLRLRSPEHLAGEMAILSHRAGGKAIFCFHDDTFLLPRPEDSLERVGAIRARLTELGVGKVGLVGKCRPECLTRELAFALRDLGVMRLYVGVENASQPGQDHYRRRTRTAQIEQAMRAMNEAGIFGCYNLLLFEPDATLEDVRENIAFMRRFPENPVNFCRAEAYHGTPLQRRLAVENNLGGSFLGWDYRIRDDRTELLFRISSAAFRGRNFDPNGVANRSMGIGYMAQVMRYFFDCSSGCARALLRRSAELVREVSLETARLLEEALELALGADLGDRDRIERETARLALRIAAHDQLWHKAFDELVAEVHEFTRKQATSSAPRALPTRLREAVGQLALAGSIVAVLPACGDTTREPPVAGAGAGGQDGGMWFDPLPPDAGTAGRATGGTTGMGGMWFDPLPVDAGTGGRATGGTTGMGGMWFDPLPSDARSNGTQATEAEQASASQPAVGHFTDVTPRRSTRSPDLPFHDPPRIALRSERCDDQVRVALCGGSEAMTIRWESGEGPQEALGDQREVTWRPENEDDQLTVVVRTRGGVAVAAVRARQVGRRSS